MKNFVFVNLAIESGYYGINHGIAYLAPIIKKFGYEVSVINLEHEISDQEFIEKVVKLNPSIIGFSATSPQLKYLIKYSKAIADIPQILQLAGGVGPTLSPEMILTQSKVKGVAIGESEKSIFQLLERLDQKKDISNIEGFYWNTNGKIEKNPTSQFVTDLSTLDFPDFSVFDRSLVVQKEEITNNQPILFVMLSRGCPYDCTYCCNKTLNNVYPSGKDYFRIPTVDYCIKFLEKSIQQYPEVKYILFQDDLMIANKEWFFNFAKKYKQKINLPYIINIRPENINHDIVEVLKKSGCEMARTGLESGNETLRKELLNRNYSNKMFIEKCNMIKEAGIKLFIYNIVGFPHETVRQMKETLKVNKKIKPDLGICTFFYPFPNTKLYDLCKKENLLLDQEEILNINNYNFMPSIKLTPGIKRKCIKIQKKIIKECS